MEIREKGKRAAFTLRLTIGLEKHDGEWIIVHEHHSQPLDFDTGRIGPGIGLIELGDQQSQSTNAFAFRTRQLRVL